MSMITEFNLQKLIVRLVKVSGTLAKVQKAAISYVEADTTRLFQNKKFVKQTTNQLLNLPKH